MTAGLAWLDQAACKGAPPELFFGPDDERDEERVLREKHAKAVCSGCAVRFQCLADAVESGCRHGVWGGEGEDDRRRRCRRELDRERYGSQPRVA